MTDEVPITRRRRRHKAAGARVFATGISAGALFGVVGAIGAQSLPSASTTRRVASAATYPPGAAPRLAPTPTTIVWRVVHRVVVVTDPPLVAVPSGRAATSWHPSSASSPTYAPIAATPAPGATPTPAPIATAPPPAPVQAPAPAPAAPTCSGSKCP